MGVERQYILATVTYAAQFPVHSLEQMWDILHKIAFMQER